MPTAVRSRALLPRLVTIMLWASSRIVLCFAVYESAIHPPDDGALPANNWTFFMLGAVLLALPMSLCLPIGVIVSWGYMRKIGTASWQWLWTWGCAAGLAVLVESWLIRSAVREWWNFPHAIGPPGPGDLGPLELLGAFAIAAAAMMIVLMIASRLSSQVPARLAR